MNKPKKQPTRLQVFTAARELCGLSIEDFAAGKAGCSVSLVYRVLKNPNKSRRVNRAIQNLIRRCPPPHFALRRAA